MSKNGYRFKDWFWPVVVFWACADTVIAPAAFAAPQTGTFEHEESVSDIAGREWAERFKKIVRIDRELKWTVSVPENYSPDRPAGLLVYVSPSNSGRIPSRWEPVLEEHNIIWVAAHRSGNRIDPRARVTLALIGPMLIGRDYAIDETRIYVAGLSGGGRVASMIAPQYPQIFRGAVYICGVNMVQKDAPLLTTNLATNRFVFLTGSRDFNQHETRRVYNQYKRLGVDNSLYHEVTGMGHENPAAADFSAAIRFLSQN